MSRVKLNGPAGLLEGRVHRAEDPAAPIALVLHPNPKHGGNMNNLVVYNLFTAFQDHGFSVLRFNFRGVGRSEGEFTRGDGELEDAKTALAWLRAEFPEARGCWIAGFSYGSWVATRLMAEEAFEGWIMVAPPANNLDFSCVQRPGSPGLIVHGAEDSLVPANVVDELVERWREGDAGRVRLERIEGATHFFDQHQAELTQVFGEFLDG